MNTRRRQRRKRALGVSALARDAFVVRPGWLTDRNVRTLVPIVFLGLLAATALVVVGFVTMPLFVIGD